LCVLLVLIVLCSLTYCADWEISAGIVGTHHGWKLVWSEEFQGVAGTPPDKTKWSPDKGGSGWGNEQLEYDTDNQNVYQDGHGNLVLEARADNPQGYWCWYGYCRYTSARISTEQHFSFTYGRIEARIKLPYGQGLWPAFWMLGSNFPKVGWPACGEFDIMESLGGTAHSIHSSIHGPGDFEDTTMYTLPHGSFSDSFHTFALEWTSKYLRFSIDGKSYYTIPKVGLIKNKQDWVFDQPFFIILNNAVGGRWPGNPNATTVFPQKMLVSYVRVYSYNN
jgi:beta-glucanase (GH16 family)